MNIISEDVTISSNNIMPAGTAGALEALTDSCTEEEGEAAVVYTAEWEPEADEIIIRYCIWEDIPVEDGVYRLSETGHYCDLCENGFLKVTGGPEGMFIAATDEESLHRAVMTFIQEKREDVFHEYAKWLNLRQEGA